MQLGDDVIMMGYAGPKYKNPKRLGQATQSLYINVDDVDKHFERSKKAGAKIIEEPQDTFYGHRKSVDSKVVSMRSKPSGFPVRCSY